MIIATCDLCKNKDNKVWVCHESIPHWCDDCLSLTSEEFEFMCASPEERETIEVVNFILGN